MSDIEARTIALIADHLHVQPVKVTRAAELETLGADSLDKIEIVFAVENAFGVVIPDDEVRDLGTVGDIVSLAERFAR